MGQKNKADRFARELMSKITCGNEFRVAVTLMLSRDIKSKYTWQDPASQAYLEDAGVDQDQAHRILLDLFYTKLITEWTELFKGMDRIKGTEALYDREAIWNRLYQQSLEIMADGKYEDITEAATELARAAVGYRCYEPWNYITAHTGQLLQTLQPGLAVDWNKAVNYLYDGYAVCEETA
jgi:hypothetical protein